MPDLNQCGLSDLEKARITDLVGLLPRGRTSVIEVGARDGRISRLLTEYFPEVTALDLEQPSFDYPGITTLAGDATRLDLDDNSYDCVVCAEVLEHIPRLSRACAELMRIARHEIVIGVPFKQDTRLWRTTCATCGRTNPPWGHVNSFDENRLRALFPGSRIVARSFVGTNVEQTNPISAFLRDVAGNPWGTYDQQEPCIHCGAKLVPPPDKRLWQRLCIALASGLDRVQSAWTRPRANWIHVVFSKPAVEG